MAEPTNADIKKDTKELVQESHENPSNADLMLAIEKTNSALVAHTHSDQDVFDKQATVNKEMTTSLASLHQWKEKVATKDDVAEIFGKELKAFFKVSGMNTKTFIIGTAVIIGALTVILGGLKTMLAWLGFTMLK